MYPRTLRFLRAVRTHLTAARYVLLAALKRRHQRDCAIGRQARQTPEIGISLRTRQFLRTAPNRLAIAHYVGSPLYARRGHFFTGVLNLSGAGRIEGFDCTAPRRCPGRPRPGVIGDPHDPHRWLAAEPVPDPLPWPAAHGRLTPIAQPTARGSLRAACKQRCATTLCARAIAQSLGRLAHAARQLAGLIRFTGVSGDAATATVTHCQNPTRITNGTPTA